MNTTFISTTLIKRHTPLHLERQLIKGCYMVGWGCRGLNISKHVEYSITEDEAESLLSLKIEKILDTIQSTVTSQLTQNMIDALVSYIHSIGCNKWSASSVLKEINLGRYNKASSFMLKNCVYGRGEDTKLKLRRVDEVSLFLTKGEFVFNKRTNLGRGRKPKAEFERRYYK